MRTAAPGWGSVLTNMGLDGFSQTWGWVEFPCGRNLWLLGCTPGLNLGGIAWPGTDFGADNG